MDTDILRTLKKMVSEVRSSREQRKLIHITYPVNIDATYQDMTATSSTIERIENISGA